MSKLTNLTGFFDCRKYKKDVARASRVMCEKEERVNLIISLDESELTEEIKEFANLSEKSGRWFVTFKIFPKNCKIYTASAKQVNFPDFEKIDGGKFEINIDFSIKHGTGTELNGCYANAIQIIRRADIPFDVVDGDDNFTTDTVPTPSAAVPTPSDTVPTPSDGADLPF